MRVNGTEGGLRAAARNGVTAYREV